MIIDLTFVSNKILIIVGYHLVLQSVSFFEYDNYLGTVSSGLKIIITPPAHAPWWVRILYNRLTTKPLNQSI